MKYFIDITIKPDVEMRENVLLNKVYTKFHKVLCDLKCNAIGVSFPEYRIMLGRVIRLHGDQSMLNDLQGLDWISGLASYCHFSDIKEVPITAKFRVISRKQANMTEAKLRRLIKRNSISSEQIKAYKAKMFTQGLDNAFLELESGSNGYLHRRYLQFGDLLNEPVLGEFDQFGLSKTATIPWF